MTEDIKEYLEEKDFLPEGYEIPTAQTGYMKFVQGENRFRILDSAIVGNETWLEDDEGNRKPKRWRTTENVTADKLGEGGLKHFWAFPVWNYAAERIQVLEITQKGIMKAIKALVKDEDWGDPKKYDIVVTREGEGMDTTYQVNPKPHKAIEEGIPVFYKDLEVNLEALFDGDDPFEKK